MIAAPSMVAINSVRNTWSVIASSSGGPASNAIAPAKIAVISRAARRLRAGSIAHDTLTQHSVAKTAASTAESRVDGSGGEAAFDGDAVSQLHGGKTEDQRGVGWTGDQTHGRQGAEDQYRRPSGHGGSGSSLVVAQSDQPFAACFAFMAGLSRP